EDGIRDFHVTGVQTCALPISSRKSRLASAADNWKGGGDSPRSSRTICRASREHIPVDGPAPIKLPGSAINTPSWNNFPQAKAARSEERRVGKECRCRWQREHR